MARHKRGALGKKQPHFRAAGATAGTGSAFLKKPPSHDRGEQQPARKWDVASTFGDPSPSGTSMQQLALNTRNKTSHWDENSSLRGRPVTFISGGFVEPLTEIDVPGDPTMTKAPTNAILPDEIKPSGKVCEISAQATCSPQMLREGDTFGAPSTTLQAEEDCRSDSSDEVILFKGRGSRNGIQPNFQKEFPESLPASEHSTFATLPTTHPSVSPPSDLDLLISGSGDECGTDAAVDDYIQNMSTEDMADMVRQLTANHRELGGYDNDIVVDIASNSNGGDNSGNGTDSDSGGGITSSGVAQDAVGKYSRRTPKRGGARDNTNNNVDNSASDDAWQLTTDSDDEHLSRLLAKQEGMGLGEEDSILLDATPAAVDSTKCRRVSKRPKPPKGSPILNPSALAKYDLTKRFPASHGSYPSAEAVADAFEQLEVTGWAGNRGRLELELSDLELKNSMQASWQKDRQRKRDRKIAREELRAQGLLGKFSNPNDPRVKYPNGMNLDDIKTEFRYFLLGSEHKYVITLAPMDAHARKIIHEIAYRFNITSKSTGSGDQRRPSLVRTKATVRFDDEFFQSVFEKYRRRIFTRFVSRATELEKKTMARKGGNTAAATVRNGEVVGGSAPEISIANKGRTMLEKMGWSTGMALGAVDNKGVTQIIEHVVKRSKAGLG
ncbi:uncharacterized protein SPSK_00455 [Sporothrix schenckii 1099-18]|uniref:Protein SQS1 n=1 Tax=Sporothrix schenckii 1099-18 TaxID=1397361 RepID=A0A0F2LTN3_SPOSC|nr:uncharacterized protein SPSK_00455 [Sporothrix schenckii 1099-18]KJR79880.1 hypothetical protein SPSK_00455 [Sporothrix schenckii 1099-18]